MVVSFPMGMLGTMDLVGGTHELIDSIYFLRFGMTVAPCSIFFCLVYIVGCVSLFTFLLVGRPSCVRR